MSTIKNKQKVYHPYLNPNSECQDDFIQMTNDIGVNRPLMTPTEWSAFCKTKRQQALEEALRMDDEFDSSYESLSIDDINRAYGSYYDI